MRDVAAMQLYRDCFCDLPMVEMKVVLKASSENLNKTHVLPTPESPISNNLYK